MTIAAQAVGEEPARARTHASLPAEAAWKTGTPAPPHLICPGGIVSVPDTGRLPGAGGGEQGGLNDCRQRGGVGVGGYHHRDRSREDAEEDLKAR
jgi:hypothetical protein